MNQKLCKRLRRQAEALTIGRPARGLQVKAGKDKFGRRTECLVNDPRSTRGVYRRMKREIRNGTSPA